MRNRKDRLADIAAHLSGTPSLHQYDAGESATITLPSGRSVRASSDIGDELDAVEVLRLKLVRDGILPDGIGAADDEEQVRHRFRLDYADGKTMEVRAFNATQAVRLAGHGQPERITNLGTLEWLVPDGPAGT